jgi:hypothetical protein
MSLRDRFPAHTSSSTAVGAVTRRKRAGLSLSLGIASSAMPHAGLSTWTLQISTAKESSDIKLRWFGSIGPVELRGLRNWSQVPSSKQLEFSKALEVVETLLFFGPDDDDFGGVDPIPTHYRSAFDLVGDNGSQELLFSDMFNNTQWPDTASELLAGSTIKDALESATQMLLDFLGQDIKVVTEAFDGTIIIVEGDLIQGQDGKIRVLWQVAENGLRLADGNILNESTGSSGTSIAGRGRTSADQLYNGLSGRGFRITIRTTATTESSCTWTFSCTGSECTLTMRGGC